MNFVLRFAQVKEDFRQPELESVLECLGVDKVSVYTAENIPKETPFYIVSLQDTDFAAKLLSRVVLLMDVYRLFSVADSFSDLIESCKRLDFTEYISDPFRFAVDSFMKTFTDKEQLDMINSFSFMALEGPVRLKDPDARCFTIMYDHVKGKWYFGERVSVGKGKASMREQVDRYSLKKRDYLGTTSMDAEIGFVMANIAKADTGHLIYDPFVGTGSLMFAAAHFRAFTLGSDIDGRQMRGGRADENGRGSLHTNVEQYGFGGRVLGGLVFDICQHPWRDALKGRLFDAILTDPPYGVRAGAKRIAKTCDRQVPLHLRHVYYPTTAPYELADMTRDLLQFAADFLVPGGRLVFWFAQDVKEKVFDPAPLFSHPKLDFKYSIPQPMRMICRWLLVYERRSNV
jgi:tRNA (guanine10-N2)-methyltransferase